MVPLKETPVLIKTKQTRLRVFKLGAKRSIVLLLVSFHENGGLPALLSGLGEIRAIFCSSNEGSIETIQDKP